MRKFFKSLAVLLALTLIVGVIPAAAADDISLQAEKILYIGGSKGQKADGTDCKAGAKKLVANMLKGGFDKSTMKVDLKSADKSIVKTTKAGRIKAVGIGTTTVTVTVFDADENQKFKQDLKVIVKKNAESVTVDGDLVDGGSYKVGQTLNVALPRQGVDTDKRDLVVAEADADKVEIKAGEKARTWTVKFLKAGEVNFIAKAYQSAAYPATTASAAIKVTVDAPAPTGIEVKAVDTFVLTFDTDVQAAGLYAKADDIKAGTVYYKVNDTEIPFSAVKSVKAEENKVTVVMYNNFSANTPYFYKVEGADDLTFTLGGTAGKDVVSIKLITDKAVVNNGQATDIKYILYNKDGIDITNTAKNDQNVNVSISAAAGTTNAYVSGETITMYTVGEKATVNAKFTYYDPNNNYTATSFEDSIVITAVEPEKEVYSGFIYTVDDGAKDMSASFTGEKHYFALEDTAYFQAALKYTKSTGTTTYVVGKDNYSNNKPLTAKVADESIAVITGTRTSPAKSYQFAIKANQLGTTNVFLGYYDDNNNFQTLAVGEIEVKPKRAATTVSATVSKSNFNTNVAVTDEKIEVTMLVKDQYGDAFAQTPEIKQLQQSIDKLPLKQASLVLPINSTTNPEKGKYVLTLTAADVTKNNDGTTAYAADANKTANIVLTIKAGNGQATASFTASEKDITAGDSLAISANGSLDTSVVFSNNGANETNDATVTIGVTRANSGYYTGKQALGATFTTINSTTKAVTGIRDSYLKKGDSAPQAGCVTGTAFAYEIIKGADRINLNDNVVSWDASKGTFNQFITVDTTKGEFAFKGIVASGSAIIKLPADTYTVRVYQIKDGIIKVFNSQVSVVDKQVTPTFEQKDQKASGSNDSTGKANVPNCFKFKFNGTDLPATAITSYDTEVSQQTNGGVFVKSATVKLPVKLKNTAGTDFTYTMTVAINKLLNK